jgi:Asp-tRNA(Asn)/Glu-tRNA(Gln) amidotransferase A subunit family amidase
LLETAGWAGASTAAKACLQDALQRAKNAGVEIVTRHDDRKVAEIENELAAATALSTKINGWETRWFIRGCRDRDASKLSRVMQERLKESETLTLSDYRAALVERARIRARYAELAAACQACVTLSAPGPAPAGLQSTGSPQFAVPSSLLGTPALSLPLFQVDGMPLGLQVLGFANEDAAAFATAAWLRDHLGAA